MHLHDIEDGFVTPESILPEPCVGRRPILPAWQERSRSSTSDHPGNPTVNTLIWKIIKTPGQYPE
ncbi:MAG: hypothetical protein ACK58T_20395, partial [Phycisphaerae bacterium]